MRDYEVKTAILIESGFDDRECNCLMFEGMKEKIVKDIQSVFEGETSLAEYITSDLNFQFMGYNVVVKYTFSCYDENEKEAESLSIYSARDVQEKLKELGYNLKKISCEAGEMDMEWLDKLEEVWFGR